MKKTIKYIAILAFDLVCAAIGGAIEDTINFYDLYNRKLIEALDPMVEYSSSTVPLLQIVGQLTDEKRQCEYEKDYWYEQYEFNCK